MSFFGLDTPQDMLLKAQRERARLGNCIDADNIFNFFVTINHIHDYVKQRTHVAQVHRDTLRAHPSMKLARTICDTAKHVHLTHATPVLGSVYENSMFAAPFGAWTFGPQKVNWVIYSEEKFTEVLSLADELLALWEQFFENHGL